jgi:ERCC4-type nuclease
MSESIMSENKPVKTTVKPDVKKTVKKEEKVVKTDHKKEPKKREKEEKEVKPVVKPEPKKAPIVEETNATIELTNVAVADPPQKGELKIILDNREGGLSKLINCEIQQLTLGDIIIGYSVEDPLVIIERKSFADLFASIKDGRYNEQSFRLHNTAGIHNHNVVYLLEGTVASLSEEKRKLLYSCITSIQLFKGFSVIRSSSIDETAKIIIAMEDKIRRDLQKGKMLHYTTPLAVGGDGGESASYLSVGVSKIKGGNIVPENIGALILSQIPGINFVTAESIMKPYSGVGGGGFRAFYTALIESDGAILDGLKNEKGRKISKTAMSNIKKYIL